MKRIHDICTTLLTLSIFVTVFLSQAWLKHGNPPQPFTATYVTGFIIVIPLVLSIILWGLTGFRGMRHIYHDKLRLAWFLSLIGFAGWAVLSQHWDFVPDSRAGVAQNAGLQIVLVFCFATVVLCHAPKLRWLLIISMIIMLIQGIIGGLQVATQSSIGLQMFGEFVLDPIRSGVSIIQSGDIRWLRPYGLLPHPNIYAGLIVVGLFAFAHWIPHQNRHLQVIGILGFGCGLWVLLLTFSRGAWASFGIAMVLSLFFIIRFYGIQRRFILVGIGTILIGITFLTIYQPLIASRVGVGEESVEMRSVADRIVFNEIAFSAIETSPYIGIGAGNFPWYAAYYLHEYTDYDLRGDNVHMVGLGIWSEYGLVGLVLLSSNVLLALIGIGRNIWLHERQRTERIAIFGIVIAYILIGLFDHYPWTLIYTQLLWFVLMAGGLTVELNTGD